MHFIMMVITLKFTHDMSITYTISLCKTILYIYIYIGIPSYIMSIYCIHWTVSRKPVTGALKNISSKMNSFPNLYTNDFF